MIRHPLHPTTYLLRNAGKTVPLIMVILLSVMLVMGIVSMINSIPYSIRKTYSYSQHVLGITPRGDPEMLPEIEHEVRENCPYPVERLVRCRTSVSNVRSIVGKWPFVVIGLERDDMQYFLAKLGGERIDGRLPERGKPEAVISEPVARNLGLKLGDVLLGPELEAYSPQEVRVVGIAQTDEWLMFNDLTYQQENHFPPIENVLVFGADLDTQDKIDRWADEYMTPKGANVIAYFKLEEDTKEMFIFLYRVLDVVIGTLVLVITFMMGMQMNIYQSQRLIEFGLLQAIGYTKRQLFRRVFTETTIVIVAGWLLGVAAALGLLSVVKGTLMDPRAFALNTLDTVAISYTIPIPIAIAAVAMYTVASRFRRFDPVGVVERRLV